MSSLTSKLYSTSIMEEKEISQDIEYEILSDVPRSSKAKAALSNFKKCLNNSPLTQANRYMILALMEDEDTIGDIARTNKTLVSDDLSEESNSSITEIAEHDDDHTDSTLDSQIKSVVQGRASEKKQKRPNKPKMIRPNAIASNNYREQLDKYRRNVKSADDLALWLIIRLPHWKFGKHIIKCLQYKLDNEYKSGWAHIIIQCYLSKKLSRSAPKSEVLAILSIVGRTWPKLFQMKAFHDVFEALYNDKFEVVVSMVKCEFCIPERLNLIERVNIANTSASDHTSPEEPES